MSEEFDIQGQVKIDTSDAETALQKLRDKQAAADKASTAAQTAVWNKMGSAALVAGAALATGLGLMIKGAAQSETANLSLATSLKNTGQYSVATMTHIDDLTNSLRKQTGVDDETQKAALAFASTMKLTETQAEALLPRLMDMSSVTGMDLQQGFRASAQALTGNVGLFQRYGVIIKKSADGTVDFNDVLKQLAVYAGQAGNQMSGAMGSGVKLKSALDELAESMGTSLLPAVTKAANGMTSLVEKFNDMPSASQAAVTNSVLAASGILLVFGATQKAVTGLAAMKTGIDTLTAGAGWAALMKLMGTAALPLTVGIAAMKGAKSDTWAAEREKLLNAFNPTYGTSPGGKYYVPTSGVLGGRGSGAYNRGVVSPEVEGGYVGYKPPFFPPVSATADQIAGNLDLQHSLYDATHSEKLQELHDLDLDVAAWKKAGLDKVLITETSAARRAEIEKKYAAESAKSAASAAAAAWSPINVSGVNVNGLSSYIGSLEGAVKVKKQTLELTLKIDGTSIKVDQSALLKLKETLGALVYAKVMAALGGSAAFGG